MNDAQLPPRPDAYRPEPGFPSAPPAPAYHSQPQPIPPGAYTVPVGGYTAQTGNYGVPENIEDRSHLLGILALLLSLVACVVIPILGGITGFMIGTRLPEGFYTIDSSMLDVLSPARTEVLWAEITFWVGTAAGIASIVLGILAIRKQQARGAGIAALVISVVAPVVFWVVLFIAVPMGTAASFAS